MTRELPLRNGLRSGNQTAVLESIGSAKRVKVGKHTAVVEWTGALQWVKVCQVSNASM